MGVILCLTNESVLQAITIFQQISKIFQVLKKNIYVQDVGVILSLTHKSVLQAIAIFQQILKVFQVIKKHVRPGCGCYFVFN